MAGFSSEMKAVSVSARIMNDLSYHQSRQMHRSKIHLENKAVLIAIILSLTAILLCFLSRLSVIGDRHYLFALSLHKTERKI